MWYRHVTTGQRQQVSPGSLRHSILESLPDWQPEPERAPAAPAVPDVPSPEQLPGMTKAELRALAQTIGVEASFRSKADLVAALTAAIAEREAGDGVRDA